MAARAAHKAQVTESSCVSQSGLGVGSRTSPVPSGRLKRRSITPSYSPHSQSAHSRYNDTANSAGFGGLG